MLILNGREGGGGGARGKGKLPTGDVSRALQKRKAHTYFTPVKGLVAGHCRTVGGDSEIPFCVLLINQ